MLPSTCRTKPIDAVNVLPCGPVSESQWLLGEIGISDFLCFHVKGQHKVTRVASLPINTSQK